MKVDGTDDDRFDVHMNYYIIHYVAIASRRYSNILIDATSIHG